MSKHEDKFFYINIIFKSENSKWTERYLQNQDSRLTSILRDLGNVFWETYSRELVSSFELNELLIRVKSIQPSEVHLTQVWRDEDCFVNYKKRALQGVSLEKLLIKKGIQVIEKCNYITENQISDLLVELQMTPHVLQFIAKKWLREDMLVGDPLKMGRNYLPFPNEG